MPLEKSLLFEQYSNKVREIHEIYNLITGNVKNIIVCRTHWCVPY